MTDLLAEEQPILYEEISKPSSALLKVTGYTAAELDFIDRLCSRDRDEKDFGKKLEIAQEGETIPWDDRMKTLLHYHLSYNLYNPKFQRLLSKQIQLWNLEKVAIDDLKAEGLKEQVDTHGKINELADKLSEQIEVLYDDIYKSPEVIAFAQEQVKKTMSPEERIRDKQKKRV